MNKIQGLGFGPYMDGQNPDRGTQIPESQIKQLIKEVAKYTDWVRSYGCDSGLEKIGPVAKAAGLKVAAGAWLGQWDKVNDTQVNNLISVVNSGNADIAVVGNEFLLNNQSPAQIQKLIGYINQVRSATKGRVPVTTGEIYPRYKDHPELVDAVDVICAHIYPFWEKMSFDKSIQFVKDTYDDLVTKAKGKTVWIAETGWPSAGNDNGSAHPSPQNAAQYFYDFITWARSKNINYFYFEFMDEKWKSDGAHWGILNANANGLKPGMDKVFGQLVPV